MKSLAYSVVKKLRAPAVFMPLLFFKSSYSVRIARSTLVCVLMLSSALRAAAQPQREVSTTKRYLSSWNVIVLGVQSDDFESMSPEIQKTALFLQSLLETSIKTAPNHALNPKELIKAKEKLRSAALLSLRKKLDTIYVGLGTASLTDENKNVWVSQLKKRKEIKKVKKDIRAIEKLKVEDIPVNSTLPAKWQTQDTYRSVSPAQDFESIADELKAQSIFYFSLVPLSDNYVIIKLYEYNSITEEITQVLETVANTKTIARLQETFDTVVHQHILGTPTGSLRVEAKINSDKDAWTKREDTAVILIDGVVAGSGYVNLPVIAQGEHSVIVNFQDQQRILVVNIRAGEQTTREVLFDINAVNTVTILSTPNNARVYVNSEWMGNTPLVLSRPYGNVADQVEFRLQDYEIARRTINSEAPPSLNVKLIPKYAISIKERFKRDRKRFYTAFSIFAISLAAPIILNGLYSSENTALQAVAPAGQATLNELQSSVMRRDAYFYSYIASALISGGLGIYATVELFRYLRTASEYHDR